MKIKITIINLLLYLCLYSNAQHQVHGRVLDGQEKMPLPHVGIKIEGSALETQTDGNGYFNLPVKKDSIILVVSSIGHTTRKISVQIPIPDPLTIYLWPDSNQLEEVVVYSGYEAIPKERATGAFSRVSNEKLNEQVSMDILSRLEAAANSIRVDRSTLASQNEISVRGTSTISGPTDVLIVVDNFPYEGDLNNINPNDIEEITILKDAAAASIWGTRAGNGVIVITTKRGKPGQPIKLAFNANVSVDSKPDLYYQNTLSSTDYIDFERFKFSVGHGLADTAARNRPVLSPVYELLIQHKDRRISNLELEGALSELAGYDVRKEYMQHIYEPGTRQQYALNLSGGTSNASWYFSTGYDKSVSTIGASRNRITLNFQNSFRLLRGLEIHTGIAYANAKSGSGRLEFDNSLEPYIRIADDIGQPLAVPHTYRKPYLDTVGNGRLLDWNHYPLTEGEHRHLQMSTGNVVLNTGLDYQPLAWIKLSAKYQFERQDKNGEDVYDVESYTARNLVNQFSQLNPSDGRIEYAIPPGGILDLSRDELRVHNLRTQVNFSHSFVDHELHALGGAELRERIATGNSLRRYGYNEELNSYAPHDPILRYPSIINGTMNLIPDNDRLWDGNNRFVSVFGNMGYTYGRRYTVTGSLRKDASNLFGLSTNEKWNLLWSSGFSWTVSNESFFQKSILNYLKLRATYGYSGNVDPSKSAVTTIVYSSRTTADTGEPSASISQFANPELRWEKVNMVNAAVDFGLWNGRINGSFDFFLKRSTDLFAPAEADYTTGINPSITKNVASLTGRGIDIEVNSLNLERGEFSWRSAVNLSIYKDKITEYYLDPSYRAGSVVTDERPNFNRREGYPLYSMFSYGWYGLDGSNGNPIGYLDGQPSQDWRSITNSRDFDALVFSGSAIPTTYGTLGNTVTLGSLSITAVIRYNFGFFFRRPTIYYSNMLSQVSGAHPDYLQRWQKPGDEQWTTIPSFVYPVNTQRQNLYRSSTVTVEKGDHIRLQYIHLNYRLEKASVRFLPFERLNIYLNMSNIGIIWKANNIGLDPEYSYSGALPPRISYSFGMNITI